MVLGLGSDDERYDEEDGGGYFGDDDYDGSGKGRRKKMIIMGVVGAVLLAMAAGVGVWWWRRDGGAGVQASEGTTDSPAPASTPATTPTKTTATTSTSTTTAATTATTSGTSTTTPPAQVELFSAEKMAELFPDPTIPEIQLDLTDEQKALIEKESDLALGKTMQKTFTKTNIRKFKDLLGKEFIPALKKRIEEIKKDAIGLEGASMAALKKKDELEAQLKALEADCQRELEAFETAQAEADRVREVGAGQSAEAASAQSGQQAARTALTKAQQAKKAAQDQYDAAKALTYSLTDPSSWWPFGRKAETEDERSARYDKHAQAKRQEEELAAVLKEKEDVVKELEEKLDAANDQLKQAQAQQLITAKSKLIAERTLQQANAALAKTRASLKTTEQAALKTRDEIVTMQGRLKILKDAMEHHEGMVKECNARMHQCDVAVTQLEASAPPADTD